MTRKRRAPPCRKHPPLELHFRIGGPSISGMNYTALEDKLGYRFKNPDLLVQALTHPSTDSQAGNAPDI